MKGKPLSGWCTYWGINPSSSLRQPLTHIPRRNLISHRPYSKWDHRWSVSWCSTDFLQLEKKNKRMGTEVICLIWNSSQRSRWEERGERLCVFFLCAGLLILCEGLVRRGGESGSHFTCPSCRPSVCWFGSWWHVESDSFPPNPQIQWYLLPHSSSVPWPSSTPLPLTPAPHKPNS